MRGRGSSLNYRDLMVLKAAVAAIRFPPAVVHRNDGCPSPRIHGIGPRLRAKILERCVPLRRGRLPSVGLMWRDAQWCKHRCLHRCKRRCDGKCRGYWPGPERPSAVSIEQKQSDCGGAFSPVR